MGMEKVVEINDKVYTLKMNRAAVRYMETRGLNVSMFDAQPATQLTKVVMTALYGGGVRKTDEKLEKLADEYLDSCDDLGPIVEDFLEMYQEVFPTRS